MMDEDRQRPGRGESKVTMPLALLLCSDEEVHDLADSWLAAAGMRVISVYSSQDAARRILEDWIELLVLDTLPIYLPGLPGLRKLKQERPHLRVILIPRVGAESEVGIARISGVDAVLVRPTSKAKFLSVVGEFGYFPQGNQASEDAPGGTRP